MENEVRYPHVLRAFAESPWAIVPERLEAIREMLAVRASGGVFTEEEIRLRIGARTPAPRGRARGSVAVIPLYGVLAPRADMFTQVSGGTSLQGFQAALREAASDASVDAILLDVDSPGGSTDQVAETAELVRAVGKQKPVWAVANTDANSAAYWIASQATRFSVTPSGTVGSIGVFAAHQDVSARDEKDGVKTTLVSAGKFKVEHSPFEPLTDEAREAIQGRVNEFYGMFVKDVARGRRVSVDAVRQGFGEGRVQTAKQAVEQGMVDAVETLDEALAGVARAAAKPSGFHTSMAVNPSVTYTATDLTTHVTNTATGSAWWLPGARTFQDEAVAARAAVTALVNRACSLAEYDRGRLTAAKREQFQAVLDDLKALDGPRDDIRRLLADTDPDKHANALLAERVRFERQRAHI